MIRYGSVVLCALGLACSDRDTAAPTIPGVRHEHVTDMLHAVLEADRIAYTKQVVNRLVKEHAVQILNPETEHAEGLRASEQWKSEHGALPLPAQMFRMGAERVAQKDIGLSYGLLSPWPLNKQNLPRTPAETAGLSAVVHNRGKTPHYGSEELGGKHYCTAVYADVAIAPACIDCHNEHRDSPRRDFKVGDVMGAVVIRILL